MSLHTDLAFGLLEYDKCRLCDWWVIFHLPVLSWHLNDGLLFSGRWEICAETILDDTRPQEQLSNFWKTGLLRTISGTESRASVDKSVGDITVDRTSVALCWKATDVRKSMLDSPAWTMEVKLSAERRISADDRQLFTLRILRQWLRVYISLFICRSSKVRKRTWETLLYYSKVCSPPNQKLFLRQSNTGSFFTLGSSFITWRPPIELSSSSSSFGSMKSSSGSLWGSEDFHSIPPAFSSRGSFFIRIDCSAEAFSYRPRMGCSGSLFIWMDCSKEVCSYGPRMGCFGSPSIFSRVSLSQLSSDFVPGLNLGFGFSFTGFAWATALLGLRGDGWVPSICCLNLEYRIRAACPLLIPKWPATSFQSIWVKYQKRSFAKRSRTYRFEVELLENRIKKLSGNTICGCRRIPSKTCHVKLKHWMYHTPRPCNSMNLAGFLWLGYEGREDTGSTFTIVLW